MVKEYTVEDTVTGKEITFEWDGNTEPTDQDMEAVFAEARAGGSQAGPEQAPRAAAQGLQGAFNAVGNVFQRAKDTATGVGQTYQDNPQTLPLAVNAVENAVKFPYTAGIQKGMQDQKAQIDKLGYAANVVYEYPNQQALGYITPTLNKLGIPTPTTGTSEKVIAGMLPGPNFLEKLKLLKYLEKVPKGVTDTAKNVVSGYAYNPSDEDILPTDSDTRFQNAAFAGSMGLVGRGIDAARKAVTPNPEDRLFVAINPANTKEKFSKDIKLVHDDLVSKGIRPKDVDSHLKAVRRVKDDYINEVEDMVAQAESKIEREIIPETSQVTRTSPILGPDGKPIQVKETRTVMREHIKGAVSGDDIEKRILDSASEYTKDMDPETMGAIRELAGRYHGKELTPSKLNEYIKKINKDLDSFYDGTVQSKYRLSGNDLKMALKAEGDAIRGALYRKLDETLPPGKAKEVKNKIGAYMDVEQELRRRYNVVKRQQLMNLQQTVNLPQAAGNIVKGVVTLDKGSIGTGLAQAGLSMAMKTEQTANSLIRKAYKPHGYNTGRYFDALAKAGIIARRKDQ